MNYLRTLTQGEAKPSILGRLLLSRFQDLPGLKVTVQSGDTTLEAKTNDKGNFSIPVPGPGKYTVRAFIPFAADVMAHSPDERGKLQTSDTLTTFEYEVEIAKNECHYRQIDTFKIDLHATAEISGNVLTTSGRPVNPGFVYLVNAAYPDDSEFEQLDASGSFKFKGVAVGEYYLVLNPRNEAPGDGHAPYARTYYPNVPDASSATKIVITEGAKLENLTLHVGSRLKDRTVSGKVVWENGRSATSAAHVSVYDGERYVRMVKLDEKGRFNFKVYGDFKYAIVAEIWGQTMGKSDRVSITNEKSTGWTVVLKRRE